MRNELSLSPLPKLFITPQQTQSPVVYLGNVCFPFNELRFWVTLRVGQVRSEAVTARQMERWCHDGTIPLPWLCQDVSLGWKYVLCLKDYSTFSCTFTLWPFSWVFLNHTNEDTKTNITIKALNFKYPPTLKYTIVLQTLQSDTTVLYCIFKYPYAFRYHRFL